MPYVQSVDFGIMEFVNTFARKSVLLDRVIFDIADSSVLQGGIFMATFWWLWFRSTKDPAVVRRDVLVAFFGGLVAVLVSRALQLALPYHQRPLHTPDLGFVLPYGIDPETMSDWNSFPSDHAVLFFAFATAIWFQSRRLGIAAMVWSLAVVCLPRLYLGYHYPSDIVAGAAIGVALMVTTRRLTRKTAFIDRMLGWEARHATAFYCVAFVATFELGVMFYDIRHLARDAFATLFVVTDTTARASTAPSIAPTPVAAVMQCPAPPEANAGH